MLSISLGLFKITAVKIVTKVAPYHCRRWCRCGVVFYDPVPRRLRHCWRRRRLFTNNINKYNDG